MTFALSLLGAPTITRGDTSRALDFERRAQLFAYLALKRSWVGRAEVATLLWPQLDSKLAFANLRKALFRLQSLPGADLLEANGSALRLEIATDVAAFEAALRERRLADALALRRGELLAGFDDHANEAWTGWLGFERERLRASWRAAAHERLTGDVDPGEAVELAARLVDDDPFDEAALGLYMTWLARSGQATHARQAYREFAARLERELGLAPGAELKALHDSLAAVTSNRPAPAAAAAGPAADDGFVGRSVELRRIGALLADEGCRLLTIVGPGGMGKTRLVRRALDELAPRFADGAAFVALEDVASPAEFAARLALELDVDPKGGTDPLDAVIGVLRERRMLLVLDNFEQLLPAASSIDSLLARCAGVKAVVTSRVRLGLAAEWLFPLDGLPCPEEEDMDRLESFDASRLFLRAARRVAPTLVATAEAQAIVDICRQVEGLPLALELAAAWTRVLSCDAIAAELKHGTELLQAVDASQPARHASIGFVFDQSWRLLTNGERQALARLSLFRGGCTPEAARAVTAAPLPVLGALADKSLLRKEGARLVLHPLVQQFAALRLEEGKDRDATQAAHAAYFLRMLVQLGGLLAVGDRTALQKVEDDFDNCRSAWAWALEQPKSDEARRCGKALLDFCDFRSRLAECLALFTAAVESPLARADAAFGALARSQLAQVLFRLDRYPEAESHARRALDEARKGDRESRWQAFKVLATCALRGGRLAEARDYFHKALEATPAETQALARATTLDHLALVEKGMGRFDEALRLGLQALAQHRALGNTGAESLCLSNLGSLQLARREYAAAADYLKSALAICEREGIVSTLQYVLSNLTEVSLNLNDLAAAENYARRALETARAADHRALVGSATLNLARLALRRQAEQAAWARLGEGASTILPLGIPILKFDVLACFAEILRSRGEVGCARQVLAFAANHPAATPGVRAELQRLLDEVPADDVEVASWPGLDLDDVLHRIVAESPVACVHLIAALRGAR